MYYIDAKPLTAAEVQHLIDEGMIYDTYHPDQEADAGFGPGERYAVCDDVLVGVVKQSLADYRNARPALRVYTSEQLAKMAVYYVGVGQVTDLDVYEGTDAKLGDPEWQFSDGPVGKRGSSYDYLSLEEGLRALSPCIVIMEDK